MILATATPLALPPETRHEEFAAAPEPAIFAEEKAPPAVSEPEIPPAQAVYVSVKRTEPRIEPPRARPLEARPLEARPLEARPLEAQRGEKREMNLSYENILALVQMGEKALKNEKPAIEIERKRER
jgi:hypothetical protein